MLCFAASFIAGASICFSVGNWALARFEQLKRHTSVVVLSTWLCVGIQCVMISQLVHEITGGEQLSFKTRILYIPFMWLASLLSTSHVYQSRNNYATTFRKLRETNASLTQIEETAHHELHAERQQLIDAVRRTIKPELKLISAEIRTIEMQSQEEHLGRILEQIDDYSLQTLRRLISELNNDEDIDSVLTQSPTTSPAPKLSVRDLPLEPIRSLQIAAGVGATVLLPVVGIQVVLAWLLQVLAVFTPLFVLKFVRDRLVRSAKLPEVTWVLLACALALTFRLEVINALPQVQAAMADNNLPAISGTLFLFSVILGALDKYFIDEYTRASEEQATANAQLTSNLKKLDTARQLARKELSRLLHGPIQGRLAAVRIKLHMLTEQTQTTQAVLTQQDIVQLAQMVEQITNDIEAFSVAQTHVAQVDVSQALDELTQNWQGLMNVSFNASPQTTTALKEDPYLARKVISACSEAITNASRHGSSTHIAIDLELTNNPNALLITAGDNGTGVSDVVVPGIGLRDIEADGGQWSFGTVESGTQFIVGFPLQAPALS
jgi:signal transduction histidine kinase